MKKTVTVHPSGESTQEREVESVEKAVKDLAKEAAQGDLTLPYTVRFPGPGDTEFAITVNDVESAQELSRQGFMF